MSIRERLAEVQGAIAEAARGAGREVGEVSLLAVSKTFPAEVVKEVVDAGQVSLGENRVQEALEKVPVLPESVEWHLIGPLQRNKVRKVVGVMEVLQGVDSVKLAGAIDRVAGELGVKQRVLLQVRVGGEETKSGFEGEELGGAMGGLAGMGTLVIEGVRTIPPPVERSELARGYFEEVRLLRDRLAGESGLELGTLSMGMSGDFEAAIAEGSTMVRVGSAIFGKRD
ncbi:MAG: YggS family pyridoxal phosphate-dependent enzyme [Verrucomicrobiota bacterium]